MQNSKNSVSEIVKWICIILSSAWAGIHFALVPILELASSHIPGFAIYAQYFAFVSSFAIVGAVVMLRGPKHGN